MKQIFTILFSRVAIIVVLATTLANGVWAQTKTDIMFAKGFGGYTTNSFSAAGTDRSAKANSTNSTGVTYAMQVFNGSTGAVRGNQTGASSNFSCRNTSTYDGYYISSVSLTVSGGTIDGSTNNRSVVYFGSSAYSNPNSSAPSGTSTKASPASSGQTTLTWTNSDQNASYFILYNLKTSGSALSANATTSLTVVWTPKSGGSSSETCATPTFSPAAGTYTSAQNVTISSATEGATIYYTTNGSDPTTSSSTYSSAISVSSSTTIKAMAVKDGYDNSAVATAAYTIVNLEHAGTEQDPYTVADARTAIDANYGLTNVYATGIVSEIVTEYSSTYHNISYNISSDGLTTSDQLQAYRGKSYNGDGFTSADDIQVGDVVVVYGTLKKYNTTYEFDQNNQLVSLERKPATPTFSPAAGVVPTNATVTISSSTTGSTIYYTTNGDTPSVGGGTTTAGTSGAASATVTIDAAKTIKAIAVKDEQRSDVAVAEFTIALPAATPTFSPAAGTFNAAQSVTISTTTPEATIYYTTNGVTPTTSSTPYTSAINVSETTTIKAIAAKDGMANSAVAEATYTIQIPSIVFDVNDNPYNVAYSASSANIHYVASYTTGDLALVICDSEGNATTYAWFNAEISGENVAATWLANDDTENSRTAYFKLTAGTTTSAIFAVVQAKKVVDYAPLPFSFDGGLGDIATTTGLTQEGLGTDYTSSPKLKFDHTGDYVILKINERPGTLTFNIKGNGFSGGTFKVQTSENGTDYSDLATYTELGNTQNESFNNLGENVRYIKWIYTSKSSGNVALGNIALASYVAPSLHTVSWTSGEHTTLSVSAGDQSSTINNGDEVASGSTVWVSVGVDEGYVFNSLTVKEAGENDVELTTITAGSSYRFVMPASNVNIASSASAAPIVTGDRYALFTGTLVEGDYIIYYDGSAMKNTVENGRLYYEEVTPENDVITTSDASIVWHIAQSGSYWTIYNADANAYAAGTGVKNKAQMIDTVEDAALWSLSGDSTYDFINKANSEGGVNAYLRNNVNNNSNYGFACYADGTGGALTLYKFQNNPTPVSITATSYNGRYWATFYNGTSRYKLPKGAQAFTMNDDHELYLLGDDGRVIPAGVAVVIIADHPSLELTNIPSVGTIEVHGGDNILRGSDSDVAKEAGTQYVLGKKDTVGFYLFNGTSIPAGKAYYIYVSE